MNSTNPINPTHPISRSRYSLSLRTLSLIVAVAFTLTTLLQDMAFACQSKDTLQRPLISSDLKGTILEKEKKLAKDIYDLIIRLQPKAEFTINLIKGINSYLAAHQLPTGKREFVEAFILEFEKNPADVLWNKLKEPSNKPLKSMIQTQEDGIYLSVVIDALRLTIKIDQTMPNQPQVLSIEPVDLGLYTTEEQVRLLANAKEVIEKRLNEQFDSGKITKDIYRSAMANTYANIEKWATDEYINKLFPNVRLAILDAIAQQRWDDLIEVFRQDITFGTAGIRGKVALYEYEFKKFVADKLNARILKGPNTINEVVLLLKTVGVIQYMRDHGLKKVAIGYDTRIAGAEIAELIAQLFIGSSDENYKFIVYLFDEACPFPELSFGITTKEVRADIGILISASHNPSNYNGYKITNSTGAQLSGAMRDEIVEDIKLVNTFQIRLKPLKDAMPGQLRWLGGSKPIRRNYYRVHTSNPENFIDMHSLHTSQVKRFLIDKDLVQKYAKDLKLGFAAYNGAGYKAVPGMLKELGFTGAKVVDSLQTLDGEFPEFEWGQQPDPGDSIAADIATNEFKDQYGEEALESLDLLIGTDPDADRAGFIIPIPQKYQELFGRKYMLLSANDAWTLLLWYRLMRKKELGQIQEPKKHYITFSHVTTDALERVAKYFGIGCLGFMTTKDGQDGSKYLSMPYNNLSTASRCWVGFTYIGLAANELRKFGLFNEGGAEESNGFSILGGPVAEGEILGQGGHVNDKDGTLAAMLMAEVACYAKSKGKTLFDLMYENIYLNPQIGMFTTANKPLPRTGSFAGASGVTEKINLLKVAQQEWLPYANSHPGEFKIAGLPVLGAVEFRRGGYDEEHYTGFPDEGLRFFFHDPDLKEGDDFTKSRNYITIRPSGTSQTIRFYVQLKGTRLSLDNIAQKNRDLSIFAERVALAAQLQLLEAANLKEKYEGMVSDQLAQLQNVDLSGEFTAAEKSSQDKPPGRKWYSIFKIPSNLFSFSLIGPVVFGNTISDMDGELSWQAVRSFLSLPPAILIPIALSFLISICTALYIFKTFYNKKLKKVKKTESVSPETDIIEVNENDKVITEPEISELLKFYEKVHTEGFLEPSEVRQAYILIHKFYITIKEKDFSHPKLDILAAQVISLLIYLIKEFEYIAAVRLNKVYVKELKNAIQEACAYMKSIIDMIDFYNTRHPGDQKSITLSVDDYEDLVRLMPSYSEKVHIQIEPSTPFNADAFITRLARLNNLFEKKVLVPGSWLPYSAGVDVSGVEAEFKDLVSGMVSGISVFSSENKKTYIDILNTLIGASKNVFGNKELKVSLTILNTVIVKKISTLKDTSNSERSVTVTILGWIGYLKALAYIMRSEDLKEADPADLENAEKSLDDARKYLQEQTSLIDDMKVLGGRILTAKDNLLIYKVQTNRVDEFMAELSKLNSAEEFKARISRFENMLSADLDDNTKVTVYRILTELYLHKAFMPERNDYELDVLKAKECLVKALEVINRIGDSELKKKIENQLSKINRISSGNGDPAIRNISANGSRDAAIFLAKAVAVPAVIGGVLMFGFGIGGIVGALFVKVVIVMAAIAGNLLFQANILQKYEEILTGQPSRAGPQSPVALAYTIDGKIKYQPALDSLTDASGILYGLIKYLYILPHELIHSGIYRLFGDTISEETEERIAYILGIIPSTILILLPVLSTFATASKSAFAAFASMAMPIQNNWARTNTPQMAGTTLLTAQIEMGIPMDTLENFKQLKYKKYLGQAKNSRLLKLLSQGKTHQEAAEILAKGDIEKMSGMDKGRVLRILQQERYKYYLNQRQVGRQMADRIQELVLKDEKSIDDAAKILAYEDISFVDELSLGDLLDKFKEIKRQRYLDDELARFISEGKSIEDAAELLADRDTSKIAQLTLTGGLGALMPDMSRGIADNGIGVLSPILLYNTKIKGKDEFVPKPDLDDFRLVLKEGRPHGLQPMQFIAPLPGFNEKVKVNIYFVPLGDSVVPIIDAVEDGGWMLFEAYPDPHPGRDYEYDFNLRAMQMYLYRAATFEMLIKLVERGDMDPDKDRLAILRNEITTILIDPKVCLDKYTNDPIITALTNNGHNAVGEFNHTVVMAGMKPFAAYLFDKMMINPKYRPYVVNGGLFSLKDLIGYTADAIMAVSKIHHEVLLTLFGDYAKLLVYEGDYRDIYENNDKAAGHRGNTNGTHRMHFQAKELRDIISRQNDGIDFAQQVLPDKPDKLLIDEINSAKDKKRAELINWLRLKGHEVNQNLALCSTTRRMVEYKRLETIAEMLTADQIKIEGALLLDTLMMDDAFSGSRVADILSSDTRLRSQFIADLEELISQASRISAGNKRRNFIFAGLKEIVSKIESAEENIVGTEMVKMLSDKKRRRQFIDSNVCVIMGGRPFGDYGPKWLGAIHNEIIHDPALRGRLVILDDYNYYDAPKLFAGIDAVIMLSDKGMEASATSMMKGFMNGAAIIGVRDGAIPELIRNDIYDFSSGKGVGWYVEYEKYLRPHAWGGLRQQLAPSSDSLLLALSAMGKVFSDKERLKNLRYNCLKASLERADVTRLQARGVLVVMDLLQVKKNAQWEFMQIQTDNLAKSINDTQEIDRLLNTLPDGWSPFVFKYHKKYDVETLWDEKKFEIDDAGSGLVGFRDNLREIFNCGHKVIDTSSGHYRNYIINLIKTYAPDSNWNDLNEYMGRYYDYENSNADRFEKIEWTLEFLDLFIKKLEERRAEITLSQSKTEEVRRKESLPVKTSLARTFIIGAVLTTIGGLFFYNITTPLLLTGLLFIFKYNFYNMINFYNLIRFYNPNKYFKGILNKEEMGSDFLRVKVSQYRIVLIEKFWQGIVNGYEIAHAKTRPDWAEEFKNILADINRFIPFSDMASAVDVSSEEITDGEVFSPDKSYVNNLQVLGGMAADVPDIYRPYSVTIKEPLEDLIRQIHKFLNIFENPAEQRDTFIDVQILSDFIVRLRSAKRENSVSTMQQEQAEQLLNYLIAKKVEIEKGIRGDHQKKIQVRIKDETYPFYVRPLIRFVKLFLIGHEYYEFRRGYNEIIADYYGLKLAFYDIWVTLIYRRPLDILSLEHEDQIDDILNIVNLRRYTMSIDQIKDPEKFIEHSNRRVIRLKLEQAALDSSSIDDQKKIIDLQAQLLVQQTAIACASTKSKKMSFRFKKETFDVVREYIKQLRQDLMENREFDISNFWIKITLEKEGIVINNIAGLDRFEKKFDLFEINVVDLPERERSVNLLNSSMAAEPRGKLRLVMLEGRVQMYKRLIEAYVRRAELYKAEEKWTADFMAIQDLEKAEKLVIAFIAYLNTYPEDIEIAERKWIEKRSEGVSHDMAMDYYNYIQRYRNDAVVIGEDIRIRLVGISQDDGWGGRIPLREKEEEEIFLRVPLPSTSLVMAGAGILASLLFVPISVNLITLWLAPSLLIWLIIKSMYEGMLGYGIFGLSGLITRERFLKEDQAKAHILKRLLSGEFGVRFKTNPLINNIEIIDELKDVAERRKSKYIRYVPSSDPAEFGKLYVPKTVACNVNDFLQGWVLAHEAKEAEIAQKTGRPWSIWSEIQSNLNIVSYIIRSLYRALKKPVQPVPAQVGVVSQLTEEGHRSDVGLTTAAVDQVVSISTSQDTAIQTGPTLTEEGLSLTGFEVLERLDEVASPEISDSESNRMVEGLVGRLDDDEVEEGPRQVMEGQMLEEMIREAADMPTPEAEVVDMPTSEAGIEGRHGRVFDPLITDKRKEELTKSLYDIAAQSRAKKGDEAGFTVTHEDFHDKDSIGDGYIRDHNGEESLSYRKFKQNIKIIKQNDQTKKYGVWITNLIESIRKKIGVLDLDYNPQILLIQKLRNLALELKDGACKVYGFDYIVENSEDYFFGHHTSGKIYLATNLIQELKKIPKLTRRQRNSLVNEYLTHEILCPIMGHEQAILIQQRLFHHNYPDKGRLSNQTMGKPYKGLLGQALRDIINRQADAKNIQAPLRVGMVGTGYVGLGTGIGFAHWGNNVVCMDIDEAKIEMLKSGKMPIYEPGLDMRMVKSCKNGMLTFTTDIKETIDNSDVVFLAVPTPYGDDGAVNLDYIKKAAGTIAGYLNSYKVIVIKSTVPPGTAKVIRGIIKEGLEARGRGDVEFDIVSNPEFLKEGTAVEDFDYPDRIVVGISPSPTSDKALLMMRRLYAPWPGRLFETKNNESAELIKYAANSYLSMKISFINLIAALAEKFEGADIKEIARFIGDDPRIGPKFLNAGIGFGGSCFPKDVSAIIEEAKRRGVGEYFKILEEVLNINQAARERFMEKISNALGDQIGGNIIGLLGLSFKPDTDDMRMAPSLDIIKYLLSKGAKEIRVYDPEAMDNARNILLNELSDKDFAKIKFYDKNEYNAEDAPYAVADGAQLLAIVTEWNQFKNLDLDEISKGLGKYRPLIGGKLGIKPTIVDGRNVFDPVKMKSLFNYLSIGRGDGESNETTNKELARHAREAFLALKVSFINAFSALAEATGADIVEVSEGAGLDSRIGREYFKAGVGYGGANLTNFANSISAALGRHGLNANIFKEAEEINSKQKERFTQRIISRLKGFSGAKIVCVLGLSYKPVDVGSIKPSEALRDAASIDVIAGLIKGGFRVRVHDYALTQKNIDVTQNANLEKTKKLLIEYIKIKLPYKSCEEIAASIDFMETFDEAISNADAVAIVTEWNEYKNMDLGLLKKSANPNLTVFDGRNIFTISWMRELGINYVSIGRQEYANMVSLGNTNQPILPIDAPRRKRYNFAVEPMALSIVPLTPSGAQDLVIRQILAGQIEEIAPSASVEESNTIETVEVIGSQI